MTEQPNTTYLLPVYGAVRLHHDGQAWMVVHYTGLEMHRTDEIAATDRATAEEWMRRSTAEIGNVNTAPRARRRMRRLSVGVFPDGSYGDPDGRLGRQRLRRAWNWTLDRLGV
jgi:hypothetical protein